MLRSLSCPGTGDMDWAKLDDVQLFKEEETEDAVYNVFLRKIRYHTTNDESAAKLLLMPGAAGSDDRKARLQWRLEEQRVLKMGSLEKVIEAVCTNKGELDATYANMLLATYRTFTTTAGFLQLVINRYNSLCDQPMSDGARENCRRSMMTLLWVWLDTYQDDFREPPMYESIAALYKFSSEVAPDGDLAQRVRETLTNLRREEETGSAFYAPVQDQAIRLRLSILDGARMAFVPAGHERIMPPVDFLSIPSKLFAAQLTYVDAELFKKVIPHHCLGSVWSYRSNKRSNVQPLTVLATVDQFNAVSHRVIALCLKHPTAPPFERAHVIEHWISVAQECRILKNFSSLKAIIAGLQSASVFRLKKAWHNVSRDKKNVFEELAEIFSEENNQSVLRELLNKEGTAKFVSPDATGTLRGTIGRTLGQTLRFQRSPLLDVPDGTTTMQGTIPYLGTFLTDLTMIDTAFKDVQGSMINMDKKRREFEVLAQIQMLQSTASLYQIIPDSIFLSWFYRLRIYDDKESYELSHEIEPDAESSSVVKQGHQRIASLGFFSPKRIALSLEDLRDLENGSATHSDITSTTHNDDETDGDTTDTQSLFEYFSSTKYRQRRPAITSLSSAKSLSDIPSQLSLAPLLIDVKLEGQQNQVKVTPETTKEGSRVGNGMGEVAPKFTPEIRLNNSECLPVKVFLHADENHCTNHYKSILLSHNDHARNVLRNTLSKYGVLCKPEEFGIYQQLPDGSELALPARGNIYYAIKKNLPEIKFVVKRRRMSLAVAKLPVVKQQRVRFSKLPF